MKVNVEVTCTPEEARAFFGLPDIKPMQDRIMGEIEERLKSEPRRHEPGAGVQDLAAGLDAGRRADAADAAGLLAAARRHRLRRQEG